MWSLSDEKLLAGFASGDPEQGAAFVRRYQARVYGLAVHLLRDPDAAEEVAQEAFIRAWRHAASYDGSRGQVATWLLTITRNLCRDALRSRRGDAVDPELILALAIEDSGPGPEEQAVMDSECDRVREAIWTLPHDQRRALVLAAFLGRTASQISELEGIPVGTAKTRIRTGMRKLRAALEVGYDG